MFNAELSPERYCYGPKSQEVEMGGGGGGRRREGTITKAHSAQMYGPTLFIIYVLFCSWL